MFQEKVGIICRSYGTLQPWELHAVLEALDSSIVWEEPELSGVAF